jgi:hypothetical protein
MLSGGDDDAGELIELLDSVSLDARGDPYESDRGGGAGLWPFAFVIVARRRRIFDILLTAICAAFFTDDNARCDFDE